MAGRRRNRDEGGEGCVCARDTQGERKHKEGRKAEGARCSAGEAARRGGCARVVGGGVDQEGWKGEEE